MTIDEMPNHGGHPRQQHEAEGDMKASDEMKDANGILLVFECSVKTNTTD